MKSVVIIIFLFVLSACGTSVKIHTSGAVAGKSGDAPVLLQYKFLSVTNAHELFFLNEDRKRFNVKVPADVDTTKGVVVYLPVGKRYVLSSMMYVKNGGRTEYTFGPDLTLFDLKPDYVNRLPYFEFVSTDPNAEGFVMRSESPQERESLKKGARKNFQFALPLRGLVVPELGDR